VSETDADRVVMHIASWNTARVTELCIRSMRHYAGRDFDLVVGDGGSSDGSLEMLRVRARWLRLESARQPQARQWLDHWVDEPAALPRFSDSDVDTSARVAQRPNLHQQREPRRRVPGCNGRPGFVHPTTGARRLA
jgi:GT2 family glycosyltransferase